MKPIWARPIKAQELTEAVEWIGDSAKKNHIDPDILTYPSTFALAAQKEGKAIFYMPVQRPYMLESVGPSPEATEMDEALSLKEIVHALVARAEAEGVSEIYFLGSYPKTSEFAMRHGFEEMDAKVYRLKLNSLP